MPRNPTSDDAKRASGTFKPSRSRRTMSAPPGAPEPPEWLSSEAREEWDRVVSDLVASGCLARTDRAMLAMYSTLAAELRSDPVAMSAAKLTQLRLICGELGLSPIARLKIRLPEPDTPAPERPRPRNVVSIADLLKPKEPK